MVDREAAVLLLANGIIRTAKQLPEVSSTAMWGRAALCLAGASRDWWGGNMPHPHALRFRVPMFRMHGPQWNNTRLILADARYPAIGAFYLVRTGGN